MFGESAICLLVFTYWWKELSFLHTKWTIVFILRFVKPFRASAVTLRIGCGAVLLTSAAAPRRTLASLTRLDKRDLFVKFLASSLRYLKRYHPSTGVPHVGVGVPLRRPDEIKK
ncbi:MAG: hypothetical protein PVF83_11645 [Anaerolineales bacterium]